MRAGWTDENLMRAELKAAERSRHIARRKEVYEALYPETQHGANAEDAINKRWGNTSGEVCHSYKPSFTKSTSQATGRSERSIRSDARRGSKVAPDVLDKVESGELTPEEAAIYR